MQSQFITNQDKFLSEIINSILPKCEKARFLVGYFYFSGFVEIYKKIENIPLKVLVGLDIEREIINRVREVDYHTAKNKSRGQIKNDYYSSLVDLFNETDYFDNKEKAEAFRIFFEKIKNGTLEIRKTKDPNHSKMYLFENGLDFNEGGSYPGSLITGSSNLSISGLKGRLELNAILRGESDFKEGARIFEELWKDAITIADKNNIKEFENGVIEKIWFEKLYSPYAFYIRVLHEYFSINYSKDVITASDITDGKFLNLKYQEDAVRIALSTIENHNGVIISDVVGLGKSIIGSAVAHNLRLKTIIIAPPHLVSQWEEYKTDFLFNASVFSSGKITKALDFHRTISNSREKWLIIIDEAHKYRNEYTQDYADLHKLCQGNKVMLLTATPFNNRPQDIYSMIKLFQIPSKSTLKSVDNLGREFKDLINNYSDLTKEQKNKKISEIEVKIEVEQIAKKIRAIISPLVIRRSRLDLDAISTYKKDLIKQEVEFSIVEDPELLEYPLGTLKELYLKTLNLISPPKDNEGNPIAKLYYKAARYQPIAYINEERKEHLKKKIEDAGFEYNLFRGTQRNLSKFMRHLLVRRFESSVYAFKKSLDYMINSSEGILTWIEKRNKIPIYKKGYLPSVEDFYNSTDDKNEVELSELFDKFTEKGLFEIDVEDLKSDFIDDIKSDIDILKSIRTEWFENKISFIDPKLISFKEIIREKLKREPNRKIVVFSEFADTVNYLFDKLKDENLKIFKYTSADASPSNKEIIRTNFDAGYKSDMQQDDYKVLIATDAISEGYNLHRAGAIFNYDIPYNPTRVIQRVGRINRINKKVFEKLHIFNYFPTDVGEKETRTKEISTLKMAMIHAIMGEDTKILTKNEELKSFFKERYANELKAEESLSWDTSYKEFYNSVINNEYYKDALSIPHRAKIARKVEKPASGVLVFGKKGKDFVFKVGATVEDVIPLTPEEAISLFEANVFEQPYKVSDSFDNIYQSVKIKLFQTNKGNTVEKSKRDALNKIDAMMKGAIISSDYLKDLYRVVEMDGLPGHSIRFINQLRERDYATLSKEIEQSYINKVLTTANDIDEGSEVLILSEEIK